MLKTGNCMQLSLVSCFFSVCFDCLPFERSGWNLYKQVWRFPISAKLMSDSRLKTQCLQSWIPNCCYRWNHLFLARLKLHDTWHVELQESPRISWTHINQILTYIDTLHPWSGILRHEPYHTRSYHVLELYILTFCLNSS